jgi:hypothetical protein
MDGRSGFLSRWRIRGCLFVRTAVALTSLSFVPDLTFGFGVPSHRFGSTSLRSFSTVVPSACSIS